MAILQVGSVYLKHGVLLIDRKDVSSLDGEDAIVLDLGADQGGMHIRIPDSYEVSGIKILDHEDSLVIDDDDEVMLILSSDGTALLHHESLTCTDAEARFRTSSGSSVGVDSRRIQVFWSTAGGSRRWEVPDWSV